MSHYPGPVIGSWIVRACALAIPFLLPATSIAAEKAPLIYGAVAFEQLEYRFADGSDLLVWDGDAFLGTDEQKLRLKSEGEYAIDPEEFETLETQLLYQVPLTDFFDAKAGLRYDAPAGPDRLYGVLGVSGLTPQWFEVDADLFLNKDGDVSLRLDAEYELLLTNRLILTPDLEVNVALSDDREVGIGRGLSSGELGFRLSYDLIDRAVRPYVGIAWERQFGDTGDLAMEEDGDDDDFFFVVGFKALL